MKKKPAPSPRASRARRPSPAKPCKALRLAPSRDDIAKARALFKAMDSDAREDWMDLAADDVDDANRDAGLSKHPAAVLAALGTMIEQWDGAQ